MEGKIVGSEDYEDKEGRLQLTFDMKRSELKFSGKHTCGSWFHKLSCYIWNMEGMKLFWFGIYPSPSMRQDVAQGHFFFLDGVFRACTLGQKFLVDSSRFLPAQKHRVWQAEYYQTQRFGWLWNCFDSMEHVHPRNKGLKWGNKRSELLWTLDIRNSDHHDRIVMLSVWERVCWVEMLVRLTTCQQPLICLKLNNSNFSVAKPLKK